jgi:hypothetical protein
MRNKFGRFNIYLNFGFSGGLTIGGIAFLIFLIWSMLKDPHWGLLIAIIAIAAGLFGWIFLVEHPKNCIKDIITGQTKLVGTINSMWNEKSVHNGETFYSYYIEVDRTPFEISEQIDRWLSEGDEVCIDYWPNTMTVSRVDMVKKATELKKATKRKQVSERAITRMKRRYEEDAEERERQKMLGKEKKQGHWNR